MGTVAARQLLAGASSAEAEALWLDRSRWSSFVDGFGVMSIDQGDWPEPGSRVVWDSTAGGRGRVIERVVAYEPAALLRAEVEDPQLTGTQTVSFHDGESGAEIRIELAYELKRDPGIGARLTDLFFVRRAIGDALRRTLRRFAVELQADRDLT